MNAGESTTVIVAILCATFVLFMFGRCVNEDSANMRRSKNIERCIQSRMPDCPVGDLGVFTPSAVSDSAE